MPQPSGSKRRRSLVHDPDLKDKLEEFNEIDRARLEKMKETLRLKGNSEVDMRCAGGIESVGTCQCRSEPYERAEERRHAMEEKIVIYGTNW
jgi:hypothetical protein